MIKLTKTEIRWIMNLADTSRASSIHLSNQEDTEIKALHKLHAENMKDIYNKLGTALNNGDKRIEILNG